MPDCHKNIKVKHLREYQMAEKKNTSRKLESFNISLPSSLFFSYAFNRKYCTGLCLNFVKKPEKSFLKKGQNKQRSRVTSVCFQEGAGQNPVF